MLSTCSPSATVKALELSPTLLKAYKWVSLAAAQGKVEAKSSLETLEGNLTPEQLAEGRKRAAGFKAKTAR